MPTKTLDRTWKAKICKFDTDQRQFFTPEPNPNCNNAYNILDLFVGSYCSKIKELKEIGFGSMLNSIFKVAKEAIHDVK